MSGNKLYNFITNHIFEKKITINGCENLSLRKHVQGSQYYLFNLPLPGEVQIGSYRLISHHMSVYDIPTGALDLKSQYHYTAYFQTEKGKQYRLHIFYDAQDNLVCEPLLSEIISENSFLSVECFEEMEAFGFLANISLKALVTSLRFAQKTVIRSHQTQFEELEKQASLLSKHLPNNKTDYIALIDKQLIIADEIIQCSNASRTTTEIKSYLIKLKRSVTAMIESSPVAKQVTSQSKKLDKKVQYPSRSAATKQAKADKRAVTKTSTTTETQYCFSDDLAKIRGRLQQCTQSTEDLVKNLNLLHAELVHKSYEIELGEVTVTVRDLDSIRAVENELLTIANSTLQRLIFEKKYNKAKEMSAFYHCISENFLTLALAKNDFNLLEFLLSEKIFSAQKKHIEINKNVFSSMVDYCFKSHSADNSKIDLLAKLIQLGASLMEIDSSNELPFAANILNRDHLLHPALIKVADKTLDNVLFFKQLNQVLAVLTTQPTCSIELKQKITELHEQNCGRITALNSVAVLRSSIYQPRLREANNQAREMLGNELVDQLQADPVISAMTTRAQKSLQHLLMRLKPAERNPIRQHLELHFDAMKQSLSAIKDLSLLPSLELLKNESIKQLITSMRIIALREELIDLQADLTLNQQHFHKRQVNKHNNNYLRQKILVSEIKMFSEKLEQPFTLLKDYKEKVDNYNSILNLFTTHLTNMKKILADLDNECSSSDEKDDNQKTNEADADGHQGEPSP